MRIYIAGALNNDAAHYIQNLHRMIIHAEKVRRMGTTVYVPGNDFLQGLVIGNWKYEDYVENTMSFMEICDAVSLVAGWRNSKGTQKEIKRAEELNIPVLYNLEELVNFMLEHKLPDE
jgi:oligoribonuclease NrnB/cAMP/cGMP phosphodiesterase (DHH superfamily)